MNPITARVREPSADDAIAALRAWREELAAQNDREAARVVARAISQVQRRLGLRADAGRRDDAPTRSTRSPASD